MVFKFLGLLPGSENRLQISTARFRESVPKIVYPVPSVGFKNQLPGSENRFQKSSIQFRESDPKLLNISGIR